MLYIANKKAGNTTDALRWFESFERREEALDNSRQKDQLNELVVKYEVKEKDLTIANQKLEILGKRRNIMIMIAIIVIIGLLLTGTTFYCFRNQRYKKELFKKEKYLDTQIKEITDYLEWKYNRQKETAVVEPHQNEKESSYMPQNESLIKQKELFSELRELCEKQKIYLNPDLNIDYVIHLLGTNKKYLYEAISTNSDDNFRSLVNYYRIREAKEIIERKTLNKEELEISGLFTATGFSSTPSFYRAFKLVTGLTPKEYESQIKIAGI